MSDNVKMIMLPRHLDPRGNLSVIEECREIPFKIERCYWIYDVPGGDGREGHAYRKNREVILALSGSFMVSVREPDGSSSEYVLNTCYKALYIPAGVWRELHDFSTNSVALIVASEHYDESDYLLTEEEYLTYLKSISSESD